jgi:hypothetical protein
MKTKLWVILCAHLFVCCASICVRAQAPTPCPECYFNQAPLAGHSENNGRRILNVFIEGGWDNANQASNVDAATRQAMNTWNTTRDHNGRNMLYEFRITTNRAEADVVVAPGTTSNGCGADQLGTGPGVPDTIRLGSVVRNHNVSDMAQGIEHEIGHVLRLANSYECITIMNTQISQCLHPDRYVTPNDIFRVNQHRETQPLCTSDVNGPNDTGGGGGDTCNGDPCCGDPCCGDPYCDDGGWEYCIQYTDYDCHRECIAWDYYLNRCHSEQDYINVCEPYTYVECY